MRTKDPCPICYLTRTLCICDSIPRLDFKTRVCLIVHVNELKRSSNTGRLALRALVNSKMRVRGETREPLDLSDLLTDRYRTFLFYPSVDAVELDHELVAQDGRPIQLLVPDGTWRQARKVHSRHRELKDVPRVKISAPDISKFHLRAQHRPEGMATLQAIAHALGVIEGDLVKAQLMKLYDAKVERTMLGRGLLRGGGAGFELEETT
ncbi:MAG: DTW domain-containing protein [Deltaproteobacteria bacterium RIFCSPLOWO2_02_56_12]|nr:MAG: DTW domain-containing protein [Deltaproteobacteria bacterium RBG_16_55_12]OGQ55332.1 MAG: DTW domain-containing protein [Deltaproteobacteria bacterium RIFCSPLOWO2_02_56_12]